MIYRGLYKKLRETANQAGFLSKIIKGLLSNTRAPPDRAFHRESFN